MTTETKDMQVQDVKKQEIATDGAERTRDSKCFVPRVDIYETDEALIAVADMPGVTKDSVEITLEKNVLTINGYVEPSQPDNFNLVYAEYELGDYQRSFTLSNEINLEKIEAVVKDGVLRLHLPKIGSAKTRKIAIKAG